MGSIPLPPEGFKTISEVVGYIQKHPTGEFNTIGVVVDWLPPRQIGNYVKNTFVLRDATCDDKLDVSFLKDKKDQLPQIQSNGDVVILRGMQKNDYNRAVGISVRSTWSRSCQWTVFYTTDIPDKFDRSSPQILSNRLPGYKSPGREEMAYVVDLHKSREIEIPQNPEHKPEEPSSATATVKISSDRPTHTKSRLIQDLTIGGPHSRKIFVDLTVQVVKVYQASLDRVELYVTDYTENENLFNKTYEPGPRDGDEYGYTGYSSKTWQGPWGKRTLRVALWGHHAATSGEVNVNDVILLKNVHIKTCKDNDTIEGALHSGSQNDKESDGITKVDPRNAKVKSLLERREMYWTQAREECLPLPESDDKGKKRILDSENPARGKKNKKRRHRDTSQLSKITDSLGKSESSSKSVNHNVRCKHEAQPLCSISDILDNPAHDVETPNGVKYRLPFQNFKYRTTAKVVDYYPDRLEDFSCLVDPSDDESNDGYSTNEDHPKRPKWEWQFAILVEDPQPVPKGQSKEQMVMYVCADDAEFLLNMEPEDLRKSPDTLDKLRQKLFLLWGNLQEIKDAEINATDCDARNANKLPTPPLAHSSKPFNCCVMEYGVHKEGKKCGGQYLCRPDHWDRKFRLFGARIV